MTNLLSFPEHRPQPEIHQVSQDHCPNRNPELSHFKPFCSFCLATPSNRGRATYRSGGEHITTIPSIPTPRPANVSRVETMRLPPHITLTCVAYITHHIIVPILPPIGIVPVVVRFLLVPFGLVRAVKLILHSNFPFCLLLASHLEILHAFFTIPNKGGCASAFAVPCSWGARPSPETRSS